MKEKSIISKMLLSIKVIAILGLLVNSNGLVSAYAINQQFDFYHTNRDVALTEAFAMWNSLAAFNGGAYLTNIAEHALGYFYFNNGDGELGGVDYYNFHYTNGNQVSSNNLAYSEENQAWYHTGLGVFVILLGGSLLYLPGNGGSTGGGSSGAGCRDNIDGGGTGGTQRLC